MLRCQIGYFVEQVAHVGSGVMQGQSSMGEPQFDGLVQAAHQFVWFVRHLHTDQSKRLFATSVRIRTNHSRDLVVEAEAPHGCTDKSSALGHVRSDALNAHECGTLLSVPDWVCRPSQDHNLWVLGVNVALRYDNECPRVWVSFLIRMLCFKHAHARFRRAVREDEQAVIVV